MLQARSSVRWYMAWIRFASIAYTTIPTETMSVENRDVNPIPPSRITKRISATPITENATSQEGEYVLVRIPAVGYFCV